MKRLKPNSFEAREKNNQLKSVLAFDFENFDDAELAVPYAKTFNPVPTLNMKWNRDSADNDFEENLGHVKVFAGSYKSVSFMWDHILTN